MGKKEKRIPTYLKNEKVKEIKPQKIFPIFSFIFLAKNCSLKKCDKDKKSALLDRLAKLSTISWDIIDTSHRHSFGYEKIPHEIITCDIPNNITSDTKLIAFRYVDNLPFVGFRDINIKGLFHIVFIDVDFKLYNHG